MGQKYFLTLLSSFLLCSVFSCAPMPQGPPSTADQSTMLRDLKEGNIVLNGESLGSDLGYTWYSTDIMQAYAEKKWDRVVASVIKAGHKKDISYYYLGVSAESLGYTAAALKYYKKASDLFKDNVKNHHCRSYVKDCNGINLANILPGKIEHMEEKASLTLDDNLREYYWDDTVGPQAGKTKVQAPAGEAAKNLITPSVIQALEYSGSKTTLYSGQHDIGDPSTEVFSFKIGEMLPDGSQDAAIQIGHNEVGTLPYFTYMYMLHAKGDDLELVGPVFLDDRAKLRYQSLQNGKITTLLTVHKNGDAPCCPTLKLKVDFQIGKGKLIVSGPDKVKFEKSLKGLEDRFIEQTSTHSVRSTLGHGQ